MPLIPQMIKHQLSMTLFMLYSTRTTHIKEIIQIFNIVLPILLAHYLIRECRLRHAYSNTHLTAPLRLRHMT